MLTDTPAAGRIEFRDGDSGASVVLSGEIDFSVADLSDAEIGAHHRPGHPFVVDLSAVTFLDSVGLSLLLRLYNCEGRLEFDGQIPQVVRSIADMTGTASVLGID